MSRKYKKPLKNCKDCRYYNFAKAKINGKEKKQEYCKIYTTFLNECERKIVRR